MTANLFQVYYTTNYNGKSSYITTLIPACVFKDVMDDPYHYIYYNYDRWHAIPISSHLISFRIHL